MPPHPCREEEKEQAAARSKRETKAETQRRRKAAQEDERKREEQKEEEARAAEAERKAAQEAERMHLSVHRFFARHARSLLSNAPVAATARSTGLTRQTLGTYVYPLSVHRRVCAC